MLLQQPCHGIDSATPGQGEQQQGTSHHLGPAKTESGELIIGGPGVVVDGKPIAEWRGYPAAVTSEVGLLARGQPQPGNGDAGQDGQKQSGERRHGHLLSGGVQDQLVGLLPIAIQNPAHRFAIHPLEGLQAFL